MDEVINSQFRAEKWELRAIKIDSKEVLMTESGIYQYNQFMNFAKLVPLVDPGRMGPVIKTIFLLEKYFFELSMLTENAVEVAFPKIKDVEAMIANSIVLSDIILPKFMTLQKESNIYSEQLSSLKTRITVLRDYISSLLASLLDQI